MIITRKHAQRLAREGKATLETIDGETVTTVDNGRRYQIVTRHDKQRVDHVPMERVV